MACSHGLANIYTLTNTLYLKEDLQLSPWALQIANVIMILAWDVKPLIGYLIDQLVPIIHKSTLIILVTSAIQICLLFLIGNYLPGVVWFVLVFFLVNVCLVFENVICEYLLVLSTKEKNKEGKEHLFNDLPIYFGTRIFFTIFSTYVGGKLLKYDTKALVYKISSLFPLVSILAVFLYLRNEKPKQGEGENLRVILRKFIQIFENKTFRNLMLVYIGIVLIPSLQSGYLFYFTNVFKMGPEELALLDIISSVFFLLALLSYTFYFIKSSPRTVFLSMNLLSAIICIFFVGILLQIPEKLGMSSKNFVYLGTSFQSLFYGISDQPLLAIICQICPENMEATIISCFTAMSNFFNEISAVIGSAILACFRVTKDDQSNLWMGQVLNSVLYVVLLFVLFRIKFPEVMEKKQTP